ncbi:MAG TPA: hypothetical protein VKM94_01780 [Blastocatellia bacterium]|nr:hypothetical protein [Blastocatellia bacterium]
MKRLLFSLALILSMAAASVFAAESNMSRVPSTAEVSAGGSTVANGDQVIIIRRRRPGYWYWRRHHRRHYYYYWRYRR